MPKIKTLHREKAGHRTRTGQICCNTRFKCESEGIGSGDRCFCEKCEAEVVIIGDRVLGSEQVACQ